MQTTITISRNKRILFSSLILMVLILIGVLFRRAWLSDRYAAKLGDQLASEQAARSQAQLLSENR